MNRRNEQDQKSTAQELLEAQQTLSLSEVLRVCAIDIVVLQQMVEESIVRPVSPETAEWQFSGNSIRRIKRLARLQTELDLDAHAAAIVLDLLDEVQRLRARLQ